MSLVNLVVDALGGLPFFSEEASQLAINRIASRIPPRPHPFSLWSHLPKPAEGEGPVSDYCSWPSLTDQRFSGRHLPPAAPEYVESLPALDEVAALFKRSGEMRTDRSSVLFMFFAQWFTDSIMRVDFTDRRKNTSNHEIDLCQIYGLDEATAHILRSHQGGRLRCQKIDGEDYLAYLFETDASGALQVKPEFAGLPYIPWLDRVFAGVSVARKSKAYATGLERGNSTIGYVAISTLFMREHNRICAQLAENNPLWDDERLFQTARMINTVILLKLVIEDYINHISGVRIFKFDPTFAERQNWYRPNWITIEFNLLYRWHSLVPDALNVNGVSLPASDYMNNNVLVEQLGLAAIINAASQQNAGRIGLFNSPEFLAVPEWNALKMGRDLRLRSYNDYRAYFGLGRMASFSELSDDESLSAKLKQIYGEIDQLEYLVGIYAEGRAAGSLFGGLLNIMVAYDAFTQILTNPLLSQNVFTAETFSQYGLDLIRDTGSIQDLAARNVTGAVVAGLGVTA